MILVIDVGNTNITFGVYESKKLVTTFRMTSRTMRTSDEYGTEILAMLQNNQIDRRKVGGAIIASVVPKVMHALIGAVVRYLHTEPLIVGSGIKTGIKVSSWKNPPYPNVRRWSVLSADPESTCGHNGCKVQ